MLYKIERIEGIGRAYAAKLGKIGIATTAELLQRCATPKGRDQVAKDAGISGKLILAWANKADLMRVKGIGEEYSDLLEAAGVDTIKELKLRVADNLAVRLKAINEKRRLVRQSPGTARVARWITTAKKLAPRLTY